MAKINTGNIEGYADMTTEQKLAALEEFDIPDPDYSGYVSKETFDKTSSELAESKRQLRAKMSEDEAAKQKEAEERAELQSKYEELLHKTAVSENKAQLLSMGYEEKLATETAEAMVSGDLKTVFANQKKHLDSFEKRIKADVLKDTPKPTGDGDSKTVTLKTLREMSPQERYNYSVTHPAEYKELYGGNEQ